MNPLLESDVNNKIQQALQIRLTDFCDKKLNLENQNIWKVPLLPSRDIAILPPQLHPNKKGLSSREGQARLMHDLASIELQAMELGLRTLIEFPNIDPQFQEQLLNVVQQEAYHLVGCLEVIKKLGFRWGDWPIHLALWQATDVQDSLLDRILIVHRYLEGSGLDAGATLLRRLMGVADSEVIPVVKMIFTEELDHVAFGNKWYRYFCKQQGLDSEQDFMQRFEKIKTKLPKRIEIIDKELRLKSGFTQLEIQFLENHRNQISKYQRKKSN